MRYEQFRESFEKYPPSWGDDEYGEDELEEEQDNKRLDWLTTKNRTTPR